MQTFLLALQILKVFLDLWKEKDAGKIAKKADTAKEIVDAFAKANPDDKATALNTIVTYLRLRDKS
jgi:hypothetical protein